MDGPPGTHRDLAATKVAQFCGLSQRTPRVLTLHTASPLHYLQTQKRDLDQIRLVLLPGCQAGAKTCLRRGQGTLTPARFVNTSQKSWSQKSLQHIISFLSMSVVHNFKCLGGLPYFLTTLSVVSKESILHNDNNV